jgi:hypothetical protein
MTIQEAISRSKARELKNKPMTKRKATKPAEPAKPELTPLPNLANWLRRMAEHADKGHITGFAGVALDTSGGAATNIHDPCGPQRLNLAGAIAQLAHLIHDSEANDRMTSLASRPDPGPIA